MLSRFSVRLAAAAAALVLAGCADSNPNAPDVPPGPVTPVPVATVTVAPDPITLVEGATTTLSATPKDRNGSVLSGRAVQWSSTNEQVATVTQTGVVRAIGAGGAIVRATSEGRTGSATINVLAPTPAPPTVARVDLDSPNVTLEEGADRVLVATPRDSNGTAIAGLGMTWTSSDASVVGVDAMGKVTAVRAGTATITVRVHGKAASATITVTAAYTFDLMYSDYLDGSWSTELFSLDLSRSDATPAPMLAGTVAGEGRPSPDGSKIAFLSTIDGIEGLYVMNRDGSNIRRVVSRVDGPVSSPTWSPDGTRLAYQSGHDHTLYDIYVINVDGTNKVNLTAGLGATDQLTPSWSPAVDGSSRIAFVHRADGKENVWTMRPDGTGRRQITTGIIDEQPSWSPDGATIVFSRTNAVFHGDLYLVEVSGLTTRPVMSFSTLGGPQSYPVFSPDGRMIAFASQHETWSSGGEFQVFTIWTDGSRLARRTTNGGMWPTFISR
jgi:Tol biopolymer transport system component